MKMILKNAEISPLQENGGFMNMNERQNMRESYSEPFG